MMDKEKEAQYLMTRLKWYKRKITDLEKEIKEEGMVVETNAGKTLCQHPAIKTLNDFTKNLLSIYDKILKLTGDDGRTDDAGELLNFIQKGNSRRKSSNS